jgi:SAM-dependent methyltransferase
MSAHACPPWLGYLLLSPLRRWLQDPAAIVAPLVRAGATVLEPGPAMGFFTLELARRVGPSGRVIAVDVQPKMLEALVRRARKAGVVERIETRLAAGEGLGVEDLGGAVDLVFAFSVVHEMPSQESFFREARAALKVGGHLFLSEPSGHVSPTDFAKTVERAQRAGFAVADRPRIRISHTALLSAA